MYTLQVIGLIAVVFTLVFSAILFSAEYEFASLRQRQLMVQWVIAGLLAVTAGGAGYVVYKEATSEYKGPMLRIENCVISSQPRELLK